MLTNLQFLISNFQSILNFKFVTSPSLFALQIKHSRQRQAGFIAITTILVVAAVVLAIGISVSLLSIGEGESGLALYKGEDTLNFVEGCTEDALLKARNSNSYVGGNITRPEGTCIVTITKVTNTWTLTVSTTATLYVRTIQAVVTRNGYGLTLISWKEI